MIEQFLRSEGIEVFASLPFSECTVISERTKKRLFGEREPEVLVMLAVPYYKKAEKKNISAYAFAKDYHLYFSLLSSRLSEYLRKNGAETDFVISGDNSPINERYAAQKCGIGFIGDNGLLINEKYGSYFFICSIYFFESLEKTEKAGTISSGTTLRKECLHCGVCREKCPGGALRNMDYGKCLSCVTQKKSITPAEEDFIRKNGSVWGCDVCQECCVFNRNVQETSIPFFNSDLIPFLTKEKLSKLIASGEFEERAYAWKGKGTVLRNLELVYPEEKENE